MTDEQETASDLGRLVARVRGITSGLEATELEAAAPARLADYRSRMKKGAGAVRTIVLAEDTAVELGPPRCASVNTVIWTVGSGQVKNGRLTLIGPGLDKLQGRECDYAQVVMLGLDKESPADPFKLETTQFLTGRLYPCLPR